MTNWDLISKIYPNVTKDYVIEYYALVKDIRGNVMLQLCNATNCSWCLFDKTKNCREGLEEFLEKDVDE